MPRIAKIHNIILRPLLEEHNKIANLIKHLDEEVNSMVSEPEPDTDFIEISILLLNNYIRRYHTIEEDVINHFDQYKLNLEEKMKVITLFNEHRESLPLLDRLIDLNDRLLEESSSINSTLIAIKDICGSLQLLLHNLGKKYFANILFDEKNRIIPNGDPTKPHMHRELDIDGEVYADCVDRSSECSIRELSDEGLTICTDQEYEIGEILEIRCKNMVTIPVLKCEVILKEKNNKHFCHELKIHNFSSCQDLFEEIINSKKD